MKLIDKVAAEINKRYEYWREKEFNSHSIESEIRMSECQHLMLLLNTIETKEVDLEKEIDEVIHNYKLNGHRHTSICSADIEWIAKHFFELGLKSKTYNS